MSKKDLNQKIYNAIIEGDSISIVKHVETAIEENNEPLKIINEILAPALKEVGDRFDKGSMYLPELIVAAETMEAAVEILQPHLLARNEKMDCPGKVLLATVKGDIHDIGKNIVGALLRASGFDVIDLGRDVSAKEIVTAADENQVDIIGLSALLSTTLPYCKDTIHLLKEKNMEDRFHVFIGGGAVTPDYAEKIGAIYGGAHADAGVRNMLNVMEASKMVTFMEVIRRTENGPFMEERDFDIEGVFRTTKALVDKYGLKYDRNELITLNPDIADGAFQAGLDLAEEVGMFCVDTSRVIKFTREELLYALNAAPKSLTVGWGADQRTIEASTADRINRPFIWAGFSGAPLSENLYRESIRSYIKEPLVDAIGHGSLHIIDGIEVRTGSPLEVRATRQELMFVRDALKREGRPGMPFVAGESSTTVLGDLAIMHPDFMPPNNFHFTPTLNELKTDYTNLTKVMSSYEYGVHNINLVDAIIGGYAGGPEGAAVVTIAAFILGLIVYRASVSLCHPAHNKWVSTSPPESIWAENLVGQAFARNSPIINIGDVWPSSGTGTKDILYEIAAITITKALTGNHPHGVGSTNGKYPHGSGLDARCMAEVAHAVYNEQMSFERGNEIVCDLVSKYEDKLADPDIGKPYDEVYDVPSAEPLAWWLDIYNKTKQEFVQDYKLIY